MNRTVNTYTIYKCMYVCIISVYITHVTCTSSFNTYGLICDDELKLYTTFRWKMWRYDSFVCNRWWMQLSTILRHILLTIIIDSSMLLKIQIDSSFARVSLAREPVYYKLMNK